MKINKAKLLDKHKSFLLRIDLGNILTNLKMKVKIKINLVSLLLIILNWILNKESKVM